MDWLSNNVKKILTLVVCLGAGCQNITGLSENGKTAEEIYNNPFYAMDTGTKDDSHRTAEAQATMLKELGYDGIGYSGVKDIPEMLVELDKNGLKMFNIYVRVEVGNKTDKYPAGLPQAIKQLAGRDTMIWLAVYNAECEVSSPAGDAAAMEVIGEIANMAQAAGLQVALYPHWRAWMERVEDTLRIARKMKRKNVGVTFNLCHWLRVDGDMTKLRGLLETARPYLLQVTINGADTNTTEWDKLIQTLDKGDFDNYQLLKILKGLGYRGPIGLQGYGVKGDVYDNLKRSMQAWRMSLSRSI